MFIFFLNKFLFLKIRYSRKYKMMHLSRAILSVKRQCMSHCRHWNQYQRVNLHMASQKLKDTWINKIIPCFQVDYLLLTSIHSQKHSYTKWTRWFLCHSIQIQLSTFLKIPMTQKISVLLHLLFYIRNKNHQL